MKRKDTRPLNVNGTPWEYKIGRNTVAIYDTEGKQYYVKFTDIHSQKTIDNGLGYLNPAVIHNYILTKILSENRKHRKCFMCNTIKPDVYLRTSPLSVELNDDYTKHYYCNSCVADLAEEI
jgi:hypothetical protein